MSNKTYKQQLIDLLTNEIKIQQVNIDIICKNCAYRNNYRAIIGYCLKCEHNNIHIQNKSRLQTYIKQVNALPANAIIPRKFRHPVINSIYLFKPELINKLYDKNQN